MSYITISTQVRSCKPGLLKYLPQLLYSCRNDYNIIIGRCMVLQYIHSSLFCKLCLPLAYIILLISRNPFYYIWAFSVPVCVHVTVYVLISHNVCPHTCVICFGQPYKNFTTCNGPPAVLSCMPQQQLLKLYSL